MKIREIKTMPTVLVISRFLPSDKLHESLTRGYQTLQKVKELLAAGTPGVVVAEIIEEIEAPTVYPTELLEPLRNQLRLQGENGNWNCNRYMHGMYNGLECALATLEHRAPQYRDKPKEWLDDRKPKKALATVSASNRTRRGVRHGQD